MVENAGPTKGGQPGSARRARGRTGPRRRPFLHIPPGRLADRHERRLGRQIEFLVRHFPAAERPLRKVLRPSLWPVRVPIAVAFVLGGLLSFLPVLGIWMLPVGLLLLAVDVPFIRPTVGWASVRSRRRVTIWRRRRRHRREARTDSNAAGNAEGSAQGEARANGSDESGPGA